MNSNNMFSLFPLRILIIFIFRIFDFSHYLILPFKTYYSLCILYVLYYIQRESVLLIRNLPFKLSIFIKIFFKLVINLKSFFLTLKRLPCSTNIYAYFTLSFNIVCTNYCRFRIRDMNTERGWGIHSSALSLLSLFTYSLLNEQLFLTQERFTLF